MLITCQRCGESVDIGDAGDHLEFHHGVWVTDPLTEFVVLDADPYLDPTVAVRRPVIPTPHEPSRGKKMLGIAGEGAIWVGVGAVKVARWLKDNTNLGPWEPGVPNEGETSSEYLRAKHHRNMGGNYGQHDDLQEQAYVKDRHGNLRPYDP